MTEVAGPPPSPVRGRIAFVFDDHFDTDRIIGAARMHDRRAHDPDYLQTWVMHDLDPGFAGAVTPGDVLVAGQLFGFGHPHAQAMRAMRALGIRTVVAESFFPSFECNERHAGMILLACPGVSAHARRGDPIEVDWRRAIVRLPGASAVLTAVPLTDHEIACLQAGGEREWLLRAMRGGIA